MSTNQRSTALYSHPFSRAYWHDAAAEVKSTKTLVIAALMIALRVATKGLSIPIAPGLRIFSVASFINALSAMIIGPVMAIPAAVISDFLGVMIWEGLGSYFLPYVLQEIGSSLIWALLLYRAKVTPWRVVIGRFLICMVINVLLGTWLNKLYYQYYGMSATAATMLTWPRIIKNLFMFPIEALVMTFFLRLMIPITSRMGLTYGSPKVGESMRFNKVQIATLVILFAVGVGSVFGYLGYYYQTTSLSSNYESDERIAANQQMLEILQEQGDEWDADSTVTIVESAYKEFLGHEITYTVAVYQVADGVTIDDSLWGLSKSPASENENLTRLATVTILYDESSDTAQILSTVLAE
ncbi:MAG: hypothetical protein LUJ09_07060 [Firmicutes bacterium]|nr:hypothetical protein [Bacillota bacterium]